MFYLGLYKLAKPLTSMLKTTLIRLANNLPSDMAENAGVGSETSFTTKLAKNLSASVDMAKDAKVGEGDGGDVEKIKRSLLSKKSNVLTHFKLKTLLEKL